MYMLLLVYMMLIYYWHLLFLIINFNMTKNTAVVYNIDFKELLMEFLCKKLYISIVM